VVAASIPLLLSVHPSSSPYTFAIVFGFAMGADYMLIPLMAAELFGPKSLARVMGFVLPLDSIGQTCFPFLLGVMRDAAGNYASGILLVSGLSLLAVLAIGMLPGGVRVER
jgi:MFS family permease